MVSCKFVVASMGAKVIELIPVVQSCALVVIEQKTVIRSSKIFFIMNQFTSKSTNKFKVILTR